MIEYTNDDIGFFFRAKSISATFSDQKTIQLTNIDFNPSKPLGHEIILSNNNYNINNNNNNNIRKKDGDDETMNNNNNNNNNHDSHNIVLDNKRIVRLYLIQPQQDWRRNQTYIWKLNSAWMSDISFDWLHWNEEGFINSEIQIPIEAIIDSHQQDLSSSEQSINNNNKNNVLNIIYECDLVEFYFDRIRMKHFYEKKSTTTKVIIHGFQLGILLNTTGLLDEQINTIDDGTTNSEISSGSTNSSSSSYCYHYESSRNKNKNNILHYYPCPKGHCSVIDGIVTTGRVHKIIKDHGLTWQQACIIGGLLFCILICFIQCCYFQCKRLMRRAQYKRIVPQTKSEEDLRLEEEN